MKKIFIFLAIIIVKVFAIYGIRMYADGDPVSAAFSSDWRSVYSFAPNPQYLNRLFKKYGQKYKMLDMMRVRGAEIPVGGTTLYAITETAEVDVVKLGTVTVVSTGAGAPVTFSIHTDSIDSNGNVMPRTRMGMLWPQATGNVELVQVVTVTKTNPTTVTITVRPKDITVSLASPADGTVLVMADSAFGQGSNQPRGITNGLIETNFTMQILKETLEIEGSEFGIDRREEMFVNTKGEWWAEAFAQTEFRLDLQEEMMCWFGTPNTNTNITDVNKHGETRAIRSTQGLWTTLESGTAGNLQLNYVLGTGFDKDKFDEIGDHFESQSVSNDIVYVAGGRGLIKSIENSGVEFLSGKNTDDYYKMMVDVMPDGVSGENIQDFGLHFVKSGNYLYCVQHLPFLDNKFGPGNDTYGFTNYGIALPMTMVTSNLRSEQGQRKVTVPNFGLGYLAKNGYSRRRIIRELDGTTGKTNFAVDPWDEMSFNMLGELCVYYLETNKGVNMKNS